MLVRKGTGEHFTEALKRVVIYLYEERDRQGVWSCHTPLFGQCLGTSGGKARKGIVGYKKVRRRTRYLRCVVKRVPKL